MTAHPGERGQERLPGDSVLRQPAAGRGAGALLGQGEEEVFHRDVLVLEAPSFAFGRVQQPGQSLGDEHLPRLGAWPGDLRPPSQVGLDRGVQRGGVGADLPDQARDQPVGSLQQSDQQVLAIDLGVPERGRLGLGGGQRLLGLLGQPVHVHGGVLLAAVRGRAGVLLRSAASSASMRSSRSRTRPMAA